MKISDNQKETDYIPAGKDARNQLLELVTTSAANQELVPPLSLDELRQHAEILIHEEGLSSRFSDFLTVLINNAVWRKTVASVPFERRILLLPQCLRNSRECGAEMDEFGLLCEQCGRCRIGQLQEEAEALGYIVLVAEGTTVVTKLIEQGKIDAVVGVSCLSVLEKTFQHMSNHAIPGIAIPLTKDGCVDTTVDMDWIRNAVFLKSDDVSSLLPDLDILRTEVDYWFTESNLTKMLNSHGTETEKTAISWLTKSGKRWRPFLAVSIFRALNGFEQQPPPAIRKIAVAVECFHKASLVHDDIEDDDEFRYGEQTLHRQYGVPFALNVGDLLLGEGYRLIAECDVSAEQKNEMLAVAAEGHRTLCLGQGAELYWVSNPAPLTASEVLEIFRRKTSPAFEVALILGAIAAGADRIICATLKQFSDALGIAYQIRDDLDDFLNHEKNGNSFLVRPSILTAVAYESSSPENQLLFKTLWEWREKISEQERIVRDLIKFQGVEEKVKLLLEHYKNQAIRSLKPIVNAKLKTLLHRITGKIFRN